MNAGIESDRRRREENIRTLAAGWMLCLNCDGTGNEFYSMYRACPECNGSGVVAQTIEPERASRQGDTTP